MVKVSKIWRYFDKVDKLSSKCKLCGKICPTAGNTSNLFSHLKNIHKDTSTSEQLVSPNISNDTDEVDRFRVSKFNLQ